MEKTTYFSRNKIKIHRQFEALPYRPSLNEEAKVLNHSKGVYLSSGYTHPDRYSKWEILVFDPPVELQTSSRNFTFLPLNERGKILNPLFYNFLKDQDYIESISLENDNITGMIKPGPDFFFEEERSKIPSIFSIIKEFIAEFRAADDAVLGFIGAFGYDLIFQFEKINFRFKRPAEKKDLRLFFFDNIYLLNRMKEELVHYLYDFESAGQSTLTIPRQPAQLTELNSTTTPELTFGGITSNCSDAEYAQYVEKVRKGMYQGDYFEVVLSRRFQVSLKQLDYLDLFNKFRERNPSPYEFFIQLGDEQLIGTSPEMFVRNNGRIIETCPISGTIKRGKNALDNADRINQLLNSEKDESELTMCTDVDRNDKSRICEPGSVKVIGRKIIEKYAGLFHTVDHVIGTLKEGFDSIDAFLSHMWAVTLTGAPKKAAVQEIEDTEKTYRQWYGGAVGVIPFNGDLNTGITIRTVHIKDHVAYYQVGATLLYDSVPAEEEQETRLKAKSFFDIFTNAPKEIDNEQLNIHDPRNRQLHVLFIDNEDSFVHTIANYIRQTGVKVTTVRTGFALRMISQINPQLVFISPGPGTPEDFNLPFIINEIRKLKIPIFGVCLGLQAMILALGGKLKLLDYPMHGKPSLIQHAGTGLFQGIPEHFEAGRYHSLIADKEFLPEAFTVTATTQDGIVMGIKAKSENLEAIQFHPESILTAKKDYGLLIIKNLVDNIRSTL